MPQAGWWGPGPSVLGVAAPYSEHRGGACTLLCLPSLLCLACTPAEPPLLLWSLLPKTLVRRPFQGRHNPLPPRLVPHCLEPASSGVAVPICPCHTCMSLCLCRPAAVLRGGMMASPCSLSWGSGGVVLPALLFFLAGLSTSLRRRGIAPCTTRCCSTVSPHTERKSISPFPPTLRQGP